jgi:hypothetical protein
VVQEHGNRVKASFAVIHKVVEMIFDQSKIGVTLAFEMFDIIKGKVEKTYLFGNICNALCLKAKFTPELWALWSLGEKDAFKFIQELELNTKIK